MSVLCIYKDIGKTPLDIIKDLKSQEKYKDTKMSYAGRLDPMARGLQLIITDNLCKNSFKFLKFDKVYEFSICFGIQTDTCDILGNITNINLQDNIFSNNQLIISDIIDKFKGKQTQKYSPYSSKRINGKPLWYYSKNNISIQIPSHNIEIYSLEYLGVEHIKLNKYIQNNVKKIKKINQNYDFRQKEIINQWEKLLNIYDQDIILLNMKAHVSSGTYIRVLVNDICEYLNIIGLTSDIYRTNVGTYKI